MSKQWKIVKSFNPKHESRKQSIRALERLNHYGKIRSKNGWVIGENIQKSKRDLYGNLISNRKKGDFYEFE